MAAPTVSARGVPALRRIPEGYQALISIAAHTTISVWEVEVDPPGTEQGEPIDITTQHNASVKQKWPRTLLEWTDSSNKVAFDPDVITEIIAIQGKVLAYTWHYPDGSQHSFWAYLKSFKVTSMKIGDYPMADVVIVISNSDPTTLAEQPPVYTAAAGT